MTELDNEALVTIFWNAGGVFEERQDIIEVALRAVFNAGQAQAFKEAEEVVRRQANLSDLMHFDRPSDFRKGVLSCLAALQATPSGDTK